MRLLVEPWHPVKVISVYRLSIHSRFRIDFRVADLVERGHIADALFLKARHPNPYVFDERSSRYLYKISCNLSSSKFMHVFYFKYYNL